MGTVHGPEVRQTGSRFIPALGSSASTNSANIIAAFTSASAYGAGAEVHFGPGLAPFNLASGFSPYAGARKYAFSVPANVRVTFADYAVLKLADGQMTGTTEADGFILGGSTSNVHFIGSGSPNAGTIDMNSQGQTGYTAGYVQFGPSAIRGLATGAGAGMTSCSVVGLRTRNTFGNPIYLSGTNACDSLTPRVNKDLHVIGNVAENFGEGMFLGLCDGGTFSHNKSYSFLGNNQGDGYEIAGCRGVNGEGNELYGSSLVSQNSGAVLDLVSSQNCVFSGTKAYNWDGAIIQQTRSTFDTTGNIFSNSYFEGCTGAVYPADATSNGTAIAHLVNSRFVRCGTSTGFIVSANTTSTLGVFNIQGCWFEGGEGLLVSGTGKINIEDSYIRVQTLAGVHGVTFMHTNGTTFVCTISNSFITARGVNGSPASLGFYAPTVVNYVPIIRGSDLRGSVAGSYADLGSATHGVGSIASDVKSD